MSSFKKKEIMVDENLSNILNLPVGSNVSFADITKKVYDYVKVNKLKRPGSPEGRDKQGYKAQETQFCFKCGSRLVANSNAVLSVIDQIRVVEPEITAGARGAEIYRCALVIIYNAVVDCNETAAAREIDGSGL